MDLTIVGCSGSFPGPDSPASCYLVTAEGFRMLLDLGNGALGSLQRYVSPADIDAVCLSHLHVDHCVDMCSYQVFRSYHPSGPLPSAEPSMCHSRICPPRLTATISGRPSPLTSATSGGASTGV